MKKWLRRIRAAVGLGLTWAAGWALVGMLIELIQEVVPGWNGALVDIWPVALAVPAFLGGVVLSGLLAAVGGSRGCRCPDSQAGGHWQAFSWRHFS